MYAEDTDQRSVKEDEQMPRNKYPEQTVEKILDAAAALFAEKGYQSTTLQDIIDATGLSKGYVSPLVSILWSVLRKVLPNGNQALHGNP